MISQIRKKNFIVDAAKPIADPVKECLENLSQSEEAKQNEDSAKQAVKLVKPIRARDSSSFTK